MFVEYVLLPTHLCPVKAGAKKEKRASQSTSSPGGCVDSKNVGGGRWRDGGTKSATNVLARSV